MHWTLAVVHILILTVISFDTFPIDLKEIQEDDTYLVDKQRKGRFIAVNQTTLLPNELSETLEKKSSTETKEIDTDDISLSKVGDTAVGEKVKSGNIQKRTPNETLHNVLDSLETDNSSGCTEGGHLLTDLSFIQEHAPDQRLQFPNERSFPEENCYDMGAVVETFPIDFHCVDNFIVPFC